MRLTDISANAAYASGAVPSLLSNSNSTEAFPTGFRELEPLKMTSDMLSPRRLRADASPITQRTASMTLDLPQPFGPTIPVKSAGIVIDVASTKDLNPERLSFLSCINSAHLFYGHRASFGTQHMQLLATGDQRHSHRKNSLLELSDPNWHYIISELARFAARTLLFPGK